LQNGPLHLKWIGLTFEIQSLGQLFRDKRMPKNRIIISSK
jgi:hypothetical protein